MCVPHPRWEHFEHQADIGVRGIGTTPADAFAQTALAVCALITDLDQIAADQLVTLQCEEPDLELLLVDWLNLLVFTIATRRLLFSRFSIDINNSRLTANAWGETIDVKRHRPAVEVKGATYTELAVYESNGEWIAQCVVDV